MIERKIEMLKVCFYEVLWIRKQKQQTKCQGRYSFDNRLLQGLQYDHNHKTTIALPLKTRSTFTFSLHNNVRSLLLAQDAVYGSVFMPTLPCHKPALLNM